MNLDTFSQFNFPLTTTKNDTKTVRIYIMSCFQVMIINIAFLSSAYQFEEICPYTQKHASGTDEYPRRNRREYSSLLVRADPYSLYKYGYIVGNNFVIIVDMVT